MKQIFEVAAYAEIIRRVEHLSPESKALWGKMNVTQMLAHVQGPMEVALGDRKLKKSILGLLFGNMAKKKILEEKPFSKNLPTDPTYIKKGDYDFDVEKAKVLSLLKRIFEGGESVIIKEPHPFFGKMTSEEWATSLWKHMDHHLNQFGV